MQVERVYKNLMT